jgi:hypothetical protein
MERVTRRLNSGIIEFVDGKGYASLTHEQGVRILFERLAEYEDVGLSPEEVRDLKNNNMLHKGERQVQETMVITDEHIEEFNSILESEGSVIRLHKRGNSVDIGLRDNQYIKNFVLNPIDVFYKKLDGFFMSKGIRALSYNNTGSCFWKFE